MTLDRAAYLESLYRLTLSAAARRLALTRVEALAILDACNGLFLAEGILGQHLRAELQDGIAGGLDEKWKIDRKSLVGRVRELPLPLSAAVEIWAAEFWASERLNDADFEREHLARMGV